MGAGAGRDEVGSDAPNSAMAQEAPLWLALQPALCSPDPLFQTTLVCMQHPQPTLTGTQRALPLPFPPLARRPTLAAKGGGT